MILRHLTEICTIFDLGTPSSKPQRIYGGLLHKMWRITTEKNSYAIKELSKNTHLKSSNVTENYDLTEHIATSFRMHNIPSISAIKKDGKYFTLIDESGYLVYPWLDSKALEKELISASHAIKIAQILANMHLINLDAPEVKMSDPEFHKQDKILKLIAKSHNYGFSFAKVLLKNQNLLLRVNSFYKNAIPLLKDHLIVSHGDLNQKNVLWDKKGNPTLIDWESARRWNPAHDLIGTCLDWSSINIKFNSEIFVKMIKAYKEAGGRISKDHMEAALHRSAGEWLNWMLYNIERICNCHILEEKNLGSEQVCEALKTIITLTQITPSIIKIIKQIM